MEVTRYRDLEVELRRLDAKMRRLGDLGIDLSLPGPALLARLRARREDMRRQHQELAATQREADRLLPEMLDLYRNGGDLARERLRALLAACPSFRWGFGWRLADRVASVEDARKTLAVFSMKDAGSDYRDQIVALDRLCAAILKARLPAMELLCEAAAWSSDVVRFPPARSTRALLLGYAARRC